VLEASLSGGGDDWAAKGAGGRWRVASVKDNDERIADRNHLNNTTTLTLRNLDGHLLRTYLETGTSGNGAMSWVEDEVWGGGRLLGTISPTEGRRFYAVDQLGTPRLVCDRCKDRKAQHDYYAEKVPPIRRRLSSGRALPMSGPRAFGEGDDSASEDWVMSPVQPGFQSKVPRITISHSARQPPGRWAGSSGRPVAEWWVRPHTREKPPPAQIVPRLRLAGVMPRGDWAVRTARGKKGSSGRKRWGQSRPSVIC